MPDTFFTASPHWGAYIILYFYIGGIAGGAYFLAALIEWFGRPGDERVARLGYYVAAIGAAVSGVLLILDLDKPLRFWHMLVQSDRAPLLILKAWSPMSIGSWGLFVFGAFATVSALAALATEGYLKWPWSRPLRYFHGGVVGRVFSAVGAFFGFFVASYTGVLLSVTNRPVWADTTLLGLLFLMSAGSTAAATLILLHRWRGAAPGDASMGFLHWFDAWALLFELIVLVAFLLSLGNVAGVFLGGWGIALVIIVLGPGILLPLALHLRPGWFTTWSRRPILTAAVLVLVGGFFLRLIVVLASASVGGYQVGA